MLAHTLAVNRQQLKAQPLTAPRRSLPQRVWLLAGLSLTVACGAEEAPAGCHEFHCIEAPAGVSIQHDFAAQRAEEPGSIYRAPFPNDSLLLESGAPQLTGFPNPPGRAIVSSLITLLSQERGFSLTSGVFFTLSGSLTEPSDAGAAVTRWVDYAASTLPTSPVRLLNVDPQSSEYLTSTPVRVELRPDGGPFGAPQLISLLPLQGRPLLPRTRYAALVLASAPALSGLPALAPSRELIALLRGIQPPGMSDAAFAAHREALSALTQAGVDPAELAGLSVFTTGDPTEGLARAVATARREQPLSVSAPLTPDEVFDDFCVYSGRVSVPVYQRGAPPYTSEGGGFELNAQGEPILDHVEEARVVVTLPRRVMPSAGFPVVLFSRTGGGGDRPLVDRGVRDASGAPIVPGSGPAREFALVGFAGVSVDGPHGGLRNITGGDEQFLMFNVSNILALRDNVRQSALELALASDLLETLTVDASACPGLGASARFDAAHQVLMGHSMGATIAPLTSAVAPRFRGMILSGAGGSYLENIMHKGKPLRVRPLAEVLLGVSGSWELHPADPVLSLFQWAAEPADPPAYATHLNKTDASPRHVLMLQGIVDNYILPPIANSLSLALSLDLGGPALDAAEPRLAEYTPLTELLPLSGGQQRPLPLHYAAGERVALVTQHPEDGVEDGHEAAFQTELPKAQYRCFLAALAQGAPPLIPDNANACSGD